MDNSSWAIVLVVIAAIVISMGNLFALSGHNAGWVIASTPTATTIDYVVSDSSFGAIQNGFNWNQGSQFSLKVDGRNICSPNREYCQYWGGSNPYVDIPEYDCKCAVGSIKTEVANTVLYNNIDVKCGGYTIPITGTSIQSEGLVFSVPPISSTGMPGAVFDGNPSCAISGSITLTNGLFQTCPNELDFDPTRTYDVQGECVYQSCETDNTVFYSWCNERPTNDLLVTSSDLGAVFCGDNVCSSFESYSVCPDDCNAPEPPTPDPLKWIKDIFASIRKLICSVLPDFIC